MFVKIGELESHEWKKIEILRQKRRKNKLNGKYASTENRQFEMCFFLPPERQPHTT